MSIVLLFTVFELSCFGVSLVLMVLGVFLVVRLRTLAGEVLEMEGELNEARDENRELNNEWVQLQGAHERLEAQNVDLLGDYKASTERVAGLTIELSAKREYIASIDAAQDALKDAKMCVDDELADEKVERRRLVELVEGERSKNAKVQSELGVMRERFEAKAVQCGELLGRVEELQVRLDDQLEANQRVRGEMVDLKNDQNIAENNLANERGKINELREDFMNQKRQLKDEFKSLSETILKRNQSELTHTSREGIAAILTPLKDEISGFKKRVETVHSENKYGQGLLKSELASLKVLNTSLSTRADNLAKALRNDKKTLGNWGEVQVERLLENAGFDKDSYQREANFKTPEGANQRPDFIIDLPEGKSLIIDSKVSLNAYVDSVNSENPEEALAFLKQHTTNLRNHIKSLSGKDYTSLPGLSVPDFTFMFMPIESAFIAAFEEDPSLFDYAYEKNIAVVTPNTLLPILKTVQSLWRVEKQNKSTEALANSAGKLHRKFVTFLEKFDDVEKKIHSLQGSFASAKTTLSVGKGNLVRMAGEFEELGVKTVKEIPMGLRE
ncbi:MAG: DNA recombination protein RmuC [Akkermansiaceae bacterium]